MAERAEEGTLNLSGYEMILLDSNIVIYASDEKRKYLRALFMAPDTFISEISILEVLGFHRLTAEDEKFFNELFSLLTILPINSQIIKVAIELRKRYNLSVGDSIIASTAKLNKLKLYTANTDDFQKINELEVINPLG